MTAEMDLVVICFQAHEETVGFFESLKEHGDVPYRLIAVVNHGEDHEYMMDIVRAGATMLMDSEFFVEFVLQENSDNEGYAKAVNAGSRLGDAKYIAVLNNDIKFLCCSLSGVVKVFESDDEIGIVGPKQIDSSGKLTHGGIIEMGNGWDKHRYWMVQDDGRADDEFDAPMVSGSAMFTRRDVWDDMAACPMFTLAAPFATGAFLPTPHFFEETYYCYHVRLHGYKCRYAGKVAMIHEWHKSTTVGSRDMEKPRQMFISALQTHGFRIGDKVGGQMWPKK